MANRWRERLAQELETRAPVSGMLAAVSRRIRQPMPPNVGWWHTLGSVAFLFVLLQLLTGVLLLAYYRPTVAEAHSSIRFIMEDVHFGWFIRKMHAWGASMVIALTLLHLARVFWTGAYRKPREFTWVFGALLLLVLMALGFTGYLLPWTQVSYWGTVVATESAAEAPLVGEWVLLLMRGGEEVTDITLGRFFAAHVVVLPFLLLLLLLGHSFFGWLHGLAPATPVQTPEPAPAAEQTGLPLWPVYALRATILALLALGIHLTLVILAPFPVHAPADPFTTPAGIKPEWYLLPPYQLMKLVEGWVGFFLINGALVVFILWPFVDAVLDRSGERRPGRRRLSLALGLLAAGVVVALGLLGYLSEQEFVLFGQTWAFDTYGMPVSTGSPGEGGG